MLKRLFAALSNLTANIEALGNTFAEANAHLRERLSLDHREDVPALSEPEDVKKNGQRTKARA